MDSKIYSDMAEAYNQVYAPKEDTIVEELIIELCDEFDAFETLEERAEFAVDVVESGTTIEFLSLVAEAIEVDITEHLQELHEGKDPLSWLKGKAARTVINALSNAARKRVLKTTTSAAVGKTGNIVRGAPVAPTVRAARKARGATTTVTRAPGGPLAAAQTRKAADVSAATRQIPGANQTSAGSLKAVTDRGVTRHNQAMNQLNTFVKAFQKTQKHSAAQTKLTKAAQGTTGSTVRIGQPGATKPVQSTGGLLGTRNVPNAAEVAKKYGTQTPAPKPAWLKGSGAKLPKPPKNPGPGEVVRANARRTAAQEKAARAAAGTRGTGTTNAYPGPEARNMTVDVPFTSTRTTGQLVKDFIGKNKGKLATGAVATTALGLTSSSGNRTAGTSPTTPPKQNLASVEPPKAPETPKVTKGTGMSNIPPGEGPVNNPNYGKPTSISKDKSETPKATVTPKPQKTTKSARQIELDKIMADKTLSKNEKWRRANRRLAQVADMRKAGASREEINKVLYNKGTKAYGAK